MVTFLYVYDTLSLGAYTEGKKNIISALIDEYDIETAEGHSGCPSGFAGRHH